MKTMLKALVLVSAVFGLNLSVFAEIYAVHGDHLGTPIRLTDSAKRIVWSATNRGYGEGIYNADPDGDGRKVDMPLRYPGQYYDKESGLHYNYFRYYDPTVGRYITSDPIGLAGGINTYAYVGGNPLKFVDPTGEAAQALPAVGIAAGFGAAFCLMVPAHPSCKAAGELARRCVNGLGDAFAKPPKDAKDPNGAKAPGKPSSEEGFEDPRGGEDWIPNPNGRGKGWKDADGNVWVPTGQGSDAHGGPHWDVQLPGGDHINVYPGGHRR